MVVIFMLYANKLIYVYLKYHIIFDYQKIPWLLSERMRRGMGFLLELKHDAKKVPLFVWKP